MSEMIERVAHAIESEFRCNKEATVESAARVAIEAMREPTDPMWSAGHDAAIEGAWLMDERLTPYGTGEVDLDEHFAIASDVESTWRAMIDAALKAPADA